VEAAHAELERLNVELQCFAALREKERQAAVARIAVLRRNIAEQQAVENKLQQRYAALHDALIKQQHSK